MTFSPLLNKNSQGRYELRHVPQLAVRGAAEFFGGVVVFFVSFFGGPEVSFAACCINEKKTVNGTRSARIL